MFSKVRIPKNRLYGENTKRSLDYFSVSQKDLMPLELINSLGIVKKASAFVNCELGKLDKYRMQLITLACDELIEGKLDKEFPLSVWQSGSGTQTNMNVNEVIANRAMSFASASFKSKNKVHPNDHVNMSQSTNDCFPTAMHIVAVSQLRERLIPSLKKLRLAFFKKEKEFNDIVKIGRTHLQDATPLTLGQEFSGYVSLIERNIKRIELVLNDLYEIAMGGTAVGTGINAHPEFSSRVAAKISELTDFPFKTHPNKFAAISSHDEIVFASGALRTAACALMKIANDIRWLGSGPRCGLGELILPSNEPGSSIMPGKINPTQCELVTMVSLQVMSNDVAIGMAGSQGNFELNAFKPVMIFNFLNSVFLLSDAAQSFAKYCITGLKANRPKIEQYVKDSLMLVTALNPIIGYDKASRIAHMALEKNITLREACAELGFLSLEEFDLLVVPEHMVHEPFAF